MFLGLYYIYNSDIHTFRFSSFTPLFNRLKSFGILRREREPGVGKLDWDGKIGMGFERNYFVENPCVGFFPSFFLDFKFYPLIVKSKTT